MKKIEENLKNTDVFVPGGYPRFTYNPREELDLERRLKSVLDNLCKLVIVTGHTKSGKTVLVRKVLPQNDAIWIDGGGITSEEDLWLTIIEKLGLFQSTSSSETENAQLDTNSKISAEGGLLFAKASAEIGTTRSSSRTGETTKSRTVSSRVIALNELKSKLTPIVIDDFHYLDKELQGNLIRALKPLIFDGLPVVVIAIPHRRYDAIKVEKEMTGRILSISIPSWSESELEYIPRTGFNILGKEIEDDVISKLAKESIGSPHLMQEFCREISKGDLKDKGALNFVFKETAETIGRPIFEKLARGPRQRSDRIERKLRSGETVDIYGLVLHGLSHIKPDLITLEYEDLRSAIKDVCVPENVPNIQEVVRVLKHLAKIASTDQSSSPVIDFVEEEKRLHITDPFFAFYLRWGDISKKS